MKTTTSDTTSSMNRSYCRFALVIPLTLACFALLPQARATCQEGCGIANDNTFLGDDALVNNTTGIDNTAIGFGALSNNTGGFNNTATGSGALYTNTSSWNTATGDNALFSNTVGSENTATGVSALFTNTTGSSNTALGGFALYYNTTGVQNTATGIEALYHNTTGLNNTANGVFALFSNTTGDNNTANGYGTLYVNTTGIHNTADGALALFHNDTGKHNTAAGYAALDNNTAGDDNTANGVNALLSNTTGSRNTAYGIAALEQNTAGSGNIALGNGAGRSLTFGDHNIDIGNQGVAAEGNTIRIGTRTIHRNTYIAGINGVTVAGGVGVIVDADGHLGTTTSSGRFKEAIKPMDKSSEAVFALQPVTFRYKKALDPDGTPQFGLVAEEVEKVNPDLVARDEQGKPYTVRYEAVNAMLLNEFLKEHRKVDELEARLAQQQKDFTARLREQDAKIQEVNDKVELSKHRTRWTRIR